MNMKSVWKRARISHQKAGLAAAAIRGQKVSVALSMLSEMRTKSAAYFLKLLTSAVANAENNYQKDISQMRVIVATADKAGYLRRYMPRAKGRGDRIQKPFSHLTVILG